MTNNNVVINTTKKTAKSILKRTIKAKFGVLSLKVKLIIGGIVILAMLLLLLIAGVISTLQSFLNNQESNNISFFGTALVSPEVERYRDSIAAELAKYDLEQYTDLLLALMMQESGGRGADPMQASESKCGKIGCIKSPEESIVYGVKHFVNVLEKANYDVKLTLQSYNFGGGFIDFVMANGGVYTKELAIEYSQKMYQKLKHTGIYKCHRPSAIQYQACYGDIEYVDAVLRYLPSAVIGSSKTLTSGISSPLNRDLYVTSPFGWRTINGAKEFHLGVDLRCNETDSVHSVKDGVVIYAGVKGTYGNLVQIKHDGFITAYAHLSKINVKKGQQVSSGQQVGACGNTGRSTGTHLHFETKTEVWGGHYNPEILLFK